MTESESVFQQPAILGEEIHHSIADADDIEEVVDEDISVGDVFRSVLGHPAASDAMELEIRAPCRARPRRILFHDLQSEP